MRIFGLIGNPLTHSYSADYFQQKFRLENLTDCDYRMFPIEKITDLPELIQTTHELIGLNVTIPYKQSVLPFIHEVDDSAAAIGAINCIRIYRSKGEFFIKGINTDFTGFENTLKPALQPHHNRAIVLGTGGSSKAVTYVLEKHGIEYTRVSRTKKERHTINYQDVQPALIREHPLIINTTPVGMYPGISQAPDIPYNAISNRHLLIDLIYNPEETRFLKLGKKSRAQTINGLEMFRSQALESWLIWNQ